MLSGNMNCAVHHGMILQTLTFDPAIGAAALNPTWAVKICIISCLCGSNKPKPLAFNM